MTTGFKSSTKRDITNNNLVTKLTIPGNDLSLLIFYKMQEHLKLPIKFVYSQTLDNLRTNFISWIYVLASKTELSNQTIFNTISLLDKLCELLENETIQDPSNFQLFAITCFFLSYKAFEKKKITISFVRKYLLSNKWEDQDIRRAEIYVLKILDFNIHSINFYSFYQFYQQIIIKHFKDEVLLNQINFLANFIMQQSLTIIEFMFNLDALEQIKIIMNTVFLLLQRLTGLDLSIYDCFFLEIANVSNIEIKEFEKYSEVLITNLQITGNFLEQFSGVNIGNRVL